MITLKQIEAVVMRLNQLTDNPTASYTRSDSWIKANIGNYHLDQSYGRISLLQMVGESGGVSTVLPGGTKAELYSQLRAFIQGLETRK